MGKGRASRAMAYFLRHCPDFVDQSGWAEIDDIVYAVGKQFPGFTAEMLMKIVSGDKKGRFCVIGNKIRANQGHSASHVYVEMVEPSHTPAILYHGTAEQFLDPILRDGLLPMTRQYVHLSADVRAAKRVGIRHGKPVVLAVDAFRLVSDGHKLKLSANGVWQAEKVPSSYLSVLSI